MNDSLDEPQLKSRNHGFTIVELLIVIVVIAILAALTAVAYTGIRERAALSALQSELSQQARQLAAWRAQNNDQYPATLGAARTAGMLSNSSGTEYTKYIANNATNPANYCATGTRSGVSYSVTSTSNAPILGECVTNLIPNPNMEGTGGYGSANVNLAISTDWSASGSTSLRQTPNNGSSADSHSPITGDVGAVRLGMQPGATYTVSGSVRLAGPQSGAGSGARDLRAFTKAGTAGYVTWSSSVVSPNSAGATRHITTFQVPTNVTEAFIRMYNGAASGGGDTWWDALMLTEGTAAYSFGDGNSPGWFWNGTPNNSTSTGPAVAQ